MKILLVNYRYFVSGGPERYMFNIKKLLESKGHEVVPFSVRYKKNLPSQYESYFASPIGDGDKVYFSEYRKNIKTISQLIARTFYSFEVRKALSHVIKKEKVEVAYILHFLRKLSPSVIDACVENRIPVIVRISDFGLICPASTLSRGKKVCELCLKGNLFPSIRYRCVKNSFTASAVNALALYLHRCLKIYQKVDYWISPSRHTLKKFVQAGFDRSKIMLIPTFLDINDIAPCYDNENYILCTSRISPEKGVLTLLKAFEICSHIKEYRNYVRLVIVGLDESEESVKIRSFVKEKSLNKVKLYPFLPGNKLFKLMSKATFTVIPSLWYENLPIALLESFAHGKPALVSNLGSLIEIVKNGDNGLLFQPGNPYDLAEKIRWMIDHPKERQEMGRRARELAEKECNPELHYERLMEVCRRILAKHGKKLFRAVGFLQENDS